MMNPIKNILVANSSLDHLGGSETFTYALIEELVTRGFSVEYFSFNNGYVAEKIEKELGVHLMSKNTYDLILANHNTCVNKLFIKGFTIQTCHGIYPSLEQPSIYADAHVSISSEVQNHLADKGFSSKLILNGINCDRFTPKKILNKKLTNVLSLCHSISANNVIRNICGILEVNFFTAYKYENPIWNIEDKINEVDLVVGLGRSAYEAMACGRPVIIWDDRKYFESVGDGYVKDKLGFSLQNNCSGRYSNKKYTIDELITEFKKYNPGDSVFFREFAIKNLNIKLAVDDYLDYYHNMIKVKSIKSNFIKKCIISTFGKKSFQNLQVFIKMLRSIFGNILLLVLSVK